MVKFCPTCKKIHPIETKICSVCRGSNLMRFCQNCKKMLPPGAVSCPICGDIDPTQVPSGSNSSGGKKKKKAIPIFLVLILLVAGGVGVWWVFLREVKDVRFANETINLMEGESTTVEYEFSPKWASPKKIQWISSNSKVASVNKNGEVSALKKGECDITIIVDGTKYSCEVVVERDGIDFAEIYNAVGGEGHYCKLGPDASYIEVDTNPSDLDEYLSLDGIEFIGKINKELEVPASISTKMARTSALDGRQSEVSGDIRVSWTYHPNRGLEVMWENNK